ncbi:MAG TPA: 50S ribosomal protein L9, partial [Dehalococcoidia bacterium]|nr:50S ribosomal protein L9 [Dehalococcoidia bacterium]
KVVFLEEVEGTASPGDVKNVANGFARNFLLPRKLAAPATDHYIEIAKAKATKHARRQERLDDETRTHILPKVDGRSVRIEVRIGEQGKLFGSVTARDIAEALQAETGVEIAHQQVSLGQAIREVGTQEVSVRLTKNVIAKVTVHVEPIGGAEEAAAAPAAAESLVAETSAAADAQDADAQKQLHDSSATSPDSGVGLEAASEAAQVAEPQVVAEIEAPDEEELENTGELG